MELLNAYKAAKIVETVENYSLSENNAITASRLPIHTENEWFFSDEEFWKTIISDPDKYKNTRINLHSFTVCDWIARVPGLYWASPSFELRKHSIEDIVVQSKDWMEFTPPGKSRKVMGGIGTITLPPNDEGKRLLSVSSSCNASLGIPVLLFPDVIEHFKLKEGDAIRIINAIWQPMAETWSKRFASTQIPRGCIIVDSVDKIQIVRRGLPVAYHPFSIMEYQSGDALLYDFVYLTVDSKLDNVRNRINDFFVSYARKENRFGRYVLNPDMVQPLFETLYTSPLEMHQASEKAKLELMYKRISKQGFKQITLDRLIEVLPHYYNSSVTIRRLANNIGVSPAMLQEDNAASMSAQLINYCCSVSKTEELIDRMNVEYPQIFNQPR
jgi:hypothetical protein